MLVLSRRIGETICIGQDVTISVVKISGNRVRIGIEAPQDVEVLRGELTSWQSNIPEAPSPATASTRATPSSEALLSMAEDCCI